jgi:hypothetical protein
MNPPSSRALDRLAIVGDVSYLHSVRGGQRWLSADVEVDGMGWDGVWMDRS